MFLIFCFLLQSLTPEVIEHAQAGAAAQKQGQYDVAIQEFLKVTELQPNSASGYANLGDSYFQKGEYDAAIPPLERALKLNPRMIGTHQTLGVALLIRGDAASAIPHLEEAKAPDLLGLAYLETGRLGGAIMALNAALEKQPNDPDLLYYFGRATEQAAKGTLDQLSKMDPGLLRKEQAAARQHPLKEVTALQAALAKQPNNPDLLYDFHAAAEVASKQAFDKILELDAASARAHQVAAERYAAAGAFRDSIREYAESLKLRPYTSGVHLALGNVFAEVGNLPAAIAQYRVETSLRPADAGAFYVLGATLLKQGQSEEAVRELGTANRLLSDKPPILLALGQAAFAANDDAQAIACWTKLLTIDKASDLAAQAHRGLAELYRKNGKTEEASREQAAFEKLKIQGGQ